jgi:hypothetical protein
MNIAEGVMKEAWPDRSIRFHDGRDPGGVAAVERELRLSIQCGEVLHQAA